MTLTTAALQPRQRQLLVDTASATETPFLFTLDSETLRCTNGGATLVWDVDRHVNGTLAALHASGSTVTEVQQVVVASAVIPPSAVGGIYTAELSFAENGAGTYTGTIAIPAGATVRDVAFRNTAVWTAATSAAMTCGDADSATGYFSSTNVKTTPAADTTGAGAGLSTQLSLGASAGSFKGGAGKFYAAAGTITCTITSVGAGTAGRSRLLVVYTIPATKLITQ
jgi:hypothetical protein